MNWYYCILALEFVGCVLAPIRDILVELRVDISDFLDPGMAVFKVANVSFNAWHCLIFAFSILFISLSFSATLYLIKAYFGVISAILAYCVLILVVPDSNICFHCGQRSNRLNNNIKILDVGLGDIVIRTRSVSFTIRNVIN